MSWLNVMMGMGQAAGKAGLSTPQAQGFNAPGMRGTDPSMDYNTLMLNPPPYAKGVAGNITSTEDIAPSDYDALVAQRQGQYQQDIAGDNPEDWDIDAGRTAQIRRNASRSRYNERMGITEPSTPLTKLSRSEELLKKREKAAAYRQAARERGASRRGATRERVGKKRYEAELGRMIKRNPPMDIAGSSQLRGYDPIDRNELMSPATPQPQYGSFRDQKGLFQGGKQGRMFGRLRDWWDRDQENKSLQMNY